VVRIISLQENVGVCEARNIGISHARKDWIAYADSDNQVRPEYLSVVASAVTENPKRDSFFGWILNRSTGVTVGNAYNRADILKGNYIDLGAFVHRKALVAKYGGFDPNLRRLVDWDLIIRYTAHKPPMFIPCVFLDYTDNESGQSSDRISVRESFLRAKVAVHSKHSPRPTVSTAI
ncbi:glycosyltransferase family 2 protein, partial [Paracoccus nototheniae]